MRSTVPRCVSEIFSPGSSSVISIPNSQARHSAAPQFTGPKFGIIWLTVESCIGLQCCLLQSLPLLLVSPNPLSPRWDNMTLKYSWPSRGVLFYATCLLNSVQCASVLLSRLVISVLEGKSCRSNDGTGSKKFNPDFPASCGCFFFFIYSKYV
jgi:hypothetical protein